VHSLELFFFMRHASAHLFGLEEYCSQPLEFAYTCSQPQRTCSVPAYQYQRLQCELSPELNHMQRTTLVHFFRSNVRGFGDFSHLRVTFSEGLQRTHSDFDGIGGAVGFLHSDKKNSGTSIHIPREPAAALVFRPASFCLIAASGR
jgi:hypothetical protein